MLSELNQLLASEHLQVGAMPLKPFNEDGLSINVFSSGCLFL